VSPTGIPQFDSVTLDCPDPLALAQFYGALLDWPAPEHAVDGDYVTLESPSGGTALTFQPDPAYLAPSWPERTVPQQMHLDLYVDDLDVGEQRAVAIGARLITTTPTFRVFADPVGHLFCLCA
jgi:predicted enzyme related to lactoylglutathione lyase